MKLHLVVITYYDLNDYLRSTPMSLQAESKNKAVLACKQRIMDRYKLRSDDIVDIHVIPNKHR